MLGPASRPFGELPPSLISSLCPVPEFCDDLLSLFWATENGAVDADARVGSLLYAC